MQTRTTCLVLEEGTLTMSKSLQRASGTICVSIIESLEQLEAASVPFDKVINTGR